MILLSALYGNWDYARISDTKPSGTAGTAYTAGAYRTVTINTEDSDIPGIVSIVGNQFILDAGTYLLEIFNQSTSGLSGSVRPRIQNITSATTLIKWCEQGFTTSAYTYQPTPWRGQISVAAAQTLELQIDTSATMTQAALSDGQSEVYWTIDLYKIA